MDEKKYGLFGRLIYTSILIRPDHCSGALNKYRLTYKPRDALNISVEPLPQMEATIRHNANLIAL